MADKNIKLVTYAGSTVTPQDDALIHETAIPKSGIIYGAKTTKKTNNMLHIAAGHGIICGRKFTVSECDVPVQLTGGASHNGRVYIHMDLSNSTDPIQILVETGAQLTDEIQQKDVNILNGVYEFNLATFMVDATTVFNVVDVFPTVSGKDLSEMEKMFVKKDSILKTMEEIQANKSEDKVAGAEAVKELSNDLGGLSFGQDADGNWGYKVGGADTVHPFRTFFLWEGEMFKNGIVSEIENNTFTVERNHTNFCCFFVPNKNVRTIKTVQSNMETTVTVWYENGETESIRKSTNITYTFKEQIKLGLVSVETRSSLDGRVSTITLE